MGTGTFPGVESGRGVTLTPHPLLVPSSKKQSGAILLISLRVFVACKNGETYLLSAFNSYYKFISELLQVIAFSFGFQIHIDT
jgi:hypothetical protein